MLFLDKSSQTSYNTCILDMTFLICIIYGGISVCLFGYVSECIYILNQLNNFHGILHTKFTYIWKGYRLYVWRARSACRPHGFETLTYPIHRGSSYRVQNKCVAAARQSPPLYWRVPRTTVNDPWGCSYRTIRYI